MKPRMNADERWCCTYNLRVSAFIRGCFSRVTMKRRLVKPLVFLLLGAIVNVAVAWGCAITTHPGGPSEIGADFEARWGIAKASAWGTMYVLSARGQAFDDMFIY